jgi:hypothetical protein
MRVKGGAHTADLQLKGRQKEEEEKIRGPGGALLYGGRTSPEPCSHFKPTRTSSPFAAMSRPRHWPLAPRWAPFWRTGATQGFWNSMELENNDRRFCPPPKETTLGVFSTQFSFS